MRVLVASAHVHFVRGGAEACVDNLVHALKRAGHEVDTLTMPFYRTPIAKLNTLIDFHEQLPFESFWKTTDKVIALRFPAFYLPHPDLTIWALHQFREALDLFDWGYPDRSAEAIALRNRVLKADRDAFKHAKRTFTIAQTVSKRLKDSINFDAPALYQPPPDAESIYEGEYLDYIFAPSRLEEMKRQTLLIEAMRYVESPVRVVIAGEGSLHERCKQLIEAHELQDRIVLTGAISREEMLAFYAHCLGVFFAPFDEDYGYITLEAMLAGKPVITCTDSGGPTEFVIDQHTGYIAEPDAQTIAHWIDQLYCNKRLAKELGQNGKQTYRDKNISWDHVVTKLVA
jgi:glycosyltransferase involved in cell wall biosynthesis